jgi:hypothetical protein
MAKSGHGCVFQIYGGFGPEICPFAMPIELEGKPGRKIKVEKVKA